MSKPTPATWVCPVCGRRVPRREAACFCGAKQEAAQQHHRQEREKKSTRIPLDVALLVLAVVGVGVYALHRMTQDVGGQAAGSGLLAGAVATPEPPPSLAAPVLPAQATPTASPNEQPAFERAPPPPLPPQQTQAPEPRPLATPTPAPPPSTLDEREQVRAAGLAAYESALQGLTSLAGRLREHLRVYQTQCSDSSQRIGGVSNCDEIEATIRRELQQIQQGLEAAEDAARRAWLLPGQVRDVRFRTLFGSREWEETAAAAQTLRR